MFSAAGFAKTWEYIDLFKSGLVCTISLSALTVIFGFILGLILSVMRLSDFCPFRFLGLTRDGRLRAPGVLTAISKFNPLDFLATAYVEILRSTPVMVQIFVIYYVVLQAILLLGLETNDLKLLTALIVAVFLAVPYWKNALPKRKTAGKEKEHA